MTRMRRLTTVEVSLVSKGTEACNADLAELLVHGLDASGAWVPQVDHRRHLDEVVERQPATANTTHEASVGQQ